MFENRPELRVIRSSVLAVCLAVLAGCGSSTSFREPPSNQ